MRLLLDQDVYQVTIEFLRGRHHDVILAADLDMARATDLMLLRTASKLGRIFVTRDRDYGNLVFIQQIRVGVIYLRMRPHDQISVHEELERVITTYSETTLMRAFVTITARGHRIRHLGVD
jgi:predicted nuclease of predicted toxin-antitoxin system